MSDYDWPKPGTVLAKVIYDGPCPQGHDAAWTASYIQQKDTPPKTETTFQCSECDVEEEAA